jgi:hypothetical protein
MYVVACIYCAICIILVCDMYLPDLQVLKIWDFGSTARSGKLSRPAKPVVREALRSVPGHVTKREYGQSTFGKRPGWIICSSANGVLATQVCLNQQVLTDKRIM